MTDGLKVITGEELGALMQEGLVPKINFIDADMGPDFPDALLEEFPFLDATGVNIDAENRSVDIYWGGYEYCIAFDRIDTPEKLMPWLDHLGEKTWKRMTPARLLALSFKCYEHFGWNRSTV